MLPHSHSHHEYEVPSMILLEERDLRFPRFSNEDAYVLGQHIRKRFKASQRYGKGKGIAIAIKSVAGHILYACTIGESGDVNLESWTCIEGMISTAIKTGHSTYYIAQDLSARGRSPEQIGLNFPEYRLDGGAFPIWLINASATPIAIVAAYGESSQEDHLLVVKSVRDYLMKVNGEEPLDDARSPKSSHRRVPSVSTF